MYALHQATLPFAAIALAVGLAGDGVVIGAPHPQTVADTAIAPTDANARCVTRRGAWVAIPFRRVDLGPDVAKVASQERVIWGPYTRTVVADSTTWAAVWQAATDTSYSPERVRLADGRDSILTGPAPVPPITFGNDAIVFAATMGRSGGPMSLVITSIRRCRRSGVLVVQTLEVTRRHGFDYPSRGFAAARVSRRIVEHRAVVFLDRRRQDL